jgi:hypothetical protein
VKKRGKTIEKIVSQWTEKRGFIPCNLEGYCLKFLKTIYCCSDSLFDAFAQYLVLEGRLKLSEHHSVKLKIGEKVT